MRCEVNVGIKKDLQAGLFSQKKKGLLRSHQRLGCIQHLAAITPLVVIPSKDFDQFAIFRHTCLSAVKNTWAWVVIEINRNQRQGVVTQDAF